jgi:hypothetical protein
MNWWRSACCGPTLLQRESPSWADLASAGIPFLDEGGRADCEFPRLLAAARQGKPLRGLSGPDRELLYLPTTT